MPPACRRIHLMHRKVAAAIRLSERPRSWVDADQYPVFPPDHVVPTEAAAEADEAC